MGFFTHCGWLLSRFETAQVFFFYEIGPLIEHYLDRVSQFEFWEGLHRVIMSQGMWIT